MNNEESLKELESYCYENCGVNKSKCKECSTFYAKNALKNAIENKITVLDIFNHKETALPAKSYGEYYIFPLVGYDSCYGNLLFNTYTDEMQYCKKYFKGEVDKIWSAFMLIKVMNLNFQLFAFLLNIIVGNKIRKDQ